MEVYAEERDIPNNLHCKNEEFYTKKKQMEKLNVSLEQAANYLIQLFYMTEKRYSCTRTKIGKLLSIVSFVYARENKVLFEDLIYKYNNCGTAIPRIMNEYDKDIYVQSCVNDDQQYIQDDLNENLKNDKYGDCCCISADVKCKVESVFRKFGSYSAQKLGECINPIVNQDGVVDAAGIINLHNIYRLNYDCLKFEDSNDTVVVEYIFKREG